MASRPHWYYSAGGTWGWPVSARQMMEDQLPALSVNTGIGFCEHGVGIENQCPFWNIVFWKPIFYIFYQVFGYIKRQKGKLGHCYSILAEAKVLNKSFKLIIKLLKRWNIVELKLGHSIQHCLLMCSQML